MAEANGRNPICTRAGCDLLHLHLHSAPRREDHIRIAFNHRFPSHNALLGLPTFAELRENRLASRNLDELFNPLDAADERVVPLLEEYAGPEGKALGQRLNAIKITCVTSK